MSILDRVILGLETTLLGLLITFVGLTLLQGVMRLMAYFSRDEGRKKPTEKTEVDPDHVPVIAAAVAAMDQGTPGGSDQEIAVIAAVTAILMEQGTGECVRSIRQVGPGFSSTWGLAGKLELMSGRGAKDRGGRLL